MSNEANCKGDAFHTGYVSDSDVESEANGQPRRRMPDSFLELRGGDEQVKPANAAGDEQVKPVDAAVNSKKYALRTRTAPTKGDDQQPIRLASTNGCKAGEKRVAPSITKRKSRKKRRTSALTHRKRPVSMEDSMEDTDKNEDDISKNMNDASDSIVIQPYRIDKENAISFDDIGGVSEYIEKFREMFYMPLVHPEYLRECQMKAPQGVLLCGPPGTGKTLIVRALASSFLGVTLYMINCADILSKWVGESERKLKAYFEEAKKNQPSIIFFDEIDGIAPVRSSNQEQVHNSIVSALLSLMDGLDNRGNIVLIGATNRIDDVDGALRRPGRFDRQFNFSLPDCGARLEILTIHTRKWKFPPSDTLKRELAQRCDGYSGADLKALCTEAAMLAFRQMYPPDKFNSKLTEEEYGLVIVDRDHFLKAISEITLPASHRGLDMQRRQLSIIVEPCLGEKFKEVISKLESIFPYRTLSSSEYQHHNIPLVHKPRFLLCGSEGAGLEHLGSAILHVLEKFPVHSLELSSLSSSFSATQLEDALEKKFLEAKRSAPSVIYIPNFHIWWQSVERQTKFCLVNQVEALPSNSKILILGTTIGYYQDSDCPLQIFYRNSIHTVKPLSRKEREMFFVKMIETAFKMQSPEKSPRTNKNESVVNVGDRVSGKRNVEETEKAERKRTLKHLFLKQTKHFNVEDLERLHSRLMASILSSKYSEDHLVHSKNDEILTPLLEFIHHKDDESKSTLKKSGRNDEPKLDMDVEAEDGDKSNHSILFPV